MTHAQASAGGDESKSSSSHRSRKFMNVTVYFLDDSSHVFQLQAKNMGQVLFEKVCKFINLLEVDYFGLEFEDEKKTKCWLDALKPLCSQIATSFPTMFFCVKFYTPDPVQLEDEFTKYLFGLQVKKDLANGFLQCNDNTAAVMISYIVQADFGDYNPDKCTDSSYLSEYKFVPLQDADLERKIMENHKKLIGQTPAEADVNLLETARRCELYGIKMTAAKDHEGVPLNLAIAHLGVLVFQNYTKINTFSWAKIRKLSFKRKKFLIKLHPEGYGYYKDTVEFFFDGRNECKNFWKKCIENHTFFRCTDAKQGMRQKPKIFSRGSSFRYSGRTQKQVSEFVREISVKRQPFQRSTSLRTPSSPSRSIGSVISPQPILPVTSLSCGSISDISKEALPPQKVLSTSEPTTPHVLPDIHGSMNGDYSKTPDTPLSGLVSPEFECSQEGFVSPDFYTQDTDDNISHDSYHVLEKEAHSTNNDCMPTNTNNASDGKVEESGVALTNGTNNDGGKSSDSLNNDSEKAIHIEKTPDEDDEYRRKSKRHRVRVFSNHVNVGQTSPTLYARANRHLSFDGPENLCKAYPRTVDFVFVNQLPAVGSFSYRDDSVELKSPSKLKLEMFQQKAKQDLDVVSDSLNGERVCSGAHPLPLGVDLLNDLLHNDRASNNQGSGAQKDISRKESALKMIADNLGTKSKQLGAGQSMDDPVEGPSTSKEMSFVPDNPDCVPRKVDRMPIKSEENHSDDLLNSRAYQNFYHMVYLDMISDSDYVDRSSHYNYNNYKFLQIGRPPELSLREHSSGEQPSNLQSDPRNANQMIIDENAREDHKNLEKLENNNNTISEPIPRNPNRIPLEEETVKELNSSNRSDYYSNSSRSENSTENYPKIEVQACTERINDERSQLSSINSINRLSEDTGFESQKSVDENSVTENRFKDSEQNSMGENYNVLHDTQQNFGTSTFYISSPYAVRLANKKKSLSDKTYCLAKELLMTERTYRKDLEIVDVVFRDEFYKQGNVNSSAVVQVLSIIDPLYEKHCSLLRDLEQRLAFWEGRPANRSSTGIKGIGDVLLAHKAMIQIHSTYLAKLPEALELLYTQLSSNPNFAQVYHQFEAQKLCYLPLTSFLLRPAFRLSYYSSVVKDLLNCYNSQHDDYENCLNMSNELKSPCESFDSRIFPVVNYVKLMELQRSLIGFTNLVDENREFIREGSLFKFTKTGSHQHMFFLFSDVVLYTIRVHDGQLRFKVQAQLPIAGLKVDETEPKHGVNHCFMLCSSEKHLVVGAPSERELSKWLEDLRMSVQNAKGKKGPIRTTSSHSLNNTSFDEKYESSDDADDMIGQRDEKMGSLHINTSIHICWHRNISISGKDLLLSMKHSLSGYLLRKFKNSSGWQKVWVVLANLCLFFYRSYLDESPLASLPLAGYRIMNTASTDLVHGDCIFKLVFKNHEYFFTVENKHTFERWMEAISVCTLTEEENTRL